MPVSSRTMRSMRVRGMWHSSAIRYAVRPNGSMNSSRSTSPGCNGAKVRDICHLQTQAFRSVVVIRNLYLVGVPFLPSEAHAILPVDPNRVLPRPVFAKGVQFVVWWYG